jgi:hypothetical protein
MLYRTNLSFIYWSILSLLIANSVYSYAESRETIQAQAMGQSTMAGRTFGVTIRIENYSTPADQRALIDAFKSGGHDAMMKTLSKMKSKGRVGITGGLGYEAAYIRSIPTSDGRIIRILTDRPINFGEAYANTRSMDYDLSFIEIRLSNDKGKSTGTLIPGGRVKVNKKKEIELETYHAQPWRLVEILER